VIIKPNFLFYNAVEGKKNNEVTCNFFVVAQLKNHVCLLQSDSVTTARFIYIFSITILKISVFL